MFEEQRTWLRNFYRSEVKSASTVVDAVPAKPAVVPQGAQWSGQLTRPETGLPPGWQPVNLPADFTEVFGYEAPLQRKDIPFEDYQRGVDDILLQVHVERNKGEVLDRRYRDNPGESDKEFLEQAQAYKAYKNSLAYKANYAGQQKAAVSTSVNCGDGVSVNYDDGSSISVTGPGGWVSIPRSAALATANALLAALGISPVSGKSSATPKYIADRYDAERAFDAVLATGLTKREAHP
jgi:hypothetical protein